MIEFTDVLNRNNQAFFERPLRTDDESSDDTSDYTDSDNTHISY